MNPMNPTIQFLKNKFSTYYSTTKLKYPERFTRREWGFMFIGESFMQRHLAFKKTSELVKFLSAKSGTKKSNQPISQNVPAHVYYSSAYYKEPGLQPMQAKVEGWLGTDLIFDLDDDHLRNIEGLTYEERLEKVKNIVRSKLLDDFILGDFGFDAKYINIAFSGSRGYHIHVKDPKVFALTSAERRELVDYLTGVGLNMDRIFPEEIYDKKEYGGKTFTKKPKMITPKMNAPGWKGRMARGIYELVNNLNQFPKDQRLDELKNICKKIRHKGRKISDNDIKSIFHELFSRPKMKLDKETFEKRNILEIFSKDLYRDIFLDIVKEHQKVEMAGETDEPVTTDVKRLIRLPTSLHGKTGFRVVPLEIDELKEFNPLKDAIAFSDDPMKIKLTITEPVKFKLGDEEYNIEPNPDPIEVPEYTGIYLLCQRKAIIESD